MGGGGGGRGHSRADLERLESVAKETLRSEAQPNRRNVFISFAAEDLAEVNLLRAQAKNEHSDLEFIDRSLHESFDSRNAEYIRRGIRERIRQASVTVVYITEHTAQSAWVDWEIRESIRQGKGVIAVHKGERPPSRLPSSIREFDIPVHRWGARELTQAIERSARERPGRP